MNDLPERRTSECPHTGEMGHTMTFLSTGGGSNPLYECDGCGQYFKVEEVEAHRLREEVKRLRWLLDHATYQPKGDASA